MLLFLSFLFLLLPLKCLVLGIECERQRTTSRIILVNQRWNFSIGCPPSFSYEWTTAKFCCYDNYDRWLERPYCCSSEIYRLVVGLGFVALVLLGSSLILFFCWIFNLPHYILWCLSCKKFHLNDWLLKGRLRGPYVDPSFYAKEPFWSRGAETNTYINGLRPMPPRIFYPAPPTNLKFRWEGGDIPLFLLASRQFHRNPYSARPHERTPPLPSLQSCGSQRMPSAISRRSSVTEIVNANRRASVANVVQHAVAQQKTQPKLVSKGAKLIQQDSTDGPTLDEEEAELREAVRNMDAADDPSSWEIMDAAEAAAIAEEAKNNAANSGSSTIFMTSASRDGLGSARSLRCDSASSDNSSDSRVGSGTTGTLVTRVSFGGKVSVQVMNQQLVSSLGLSIANLPNVQVIGNFGRDGMSTIEEDDDLPYGEEEEDERQKSVADVSEAQRPNSEIAVAVPTPKGIGRSVVVAQHRLPFRPNLPGAVMGDDAELDEDEKRKIRLARRNSAPVHF